MKNSQKFVLEGICGHDPKSLKIIGTPNQPIKTKIFPNKKKYV
jgi:hypothetical protein